MTVWNDRVVWISGASSGIGAALAVAAARRGASVVLSARNVDALEAVRAQCPDPERHEVLPLDVTQPQTFAAAHDRVLARYGRVDVLINNSGITQRGLVVDTQLEVYRRLMEVNFFGLVGLTKTVLPAMLARGSGHIVGVSSLVGKFGTPLRSGYAASKHAVHGFLDSLRAEVHDRGVRVTVVCPGYVRTGISLRALAADGSPHGVLEDGQQSGMDPDIFAERMLDAVAAERDEVIIAGRESMGVWLKRFAPGVFNRVIRRAKVT